MFNIKTNNPVGLMHEKNAIIDYVILFNREIIEFEELIVLIEYHLHMRDSFVLMEGEASDLVKNYIIDNFEDYILCKEGVMIISEKYEKLKEILDVLNDEYRLGILLGYPKCCIKKWCSMNNGEETATHKIEMWHTFQHLSYVPCSKYCKESIERNERIKKILAENT